MSGDHLAKDVFEPTLLSDIAEKAVNERVAAARHEEAADKGLALSEVRKSSALFVHSF